MNKKIIILFIILILISTYFTIFNTFYKMKSTTPLLNIKNETLTIDKVYNFISENNIEEINLLKFDFKKISDINNQSKLNLAFYHLNNNLDFKKGVSSKIIEEYLVKVFGSNINVNHEDIILIKTEEKVKYDKNNDIYIIDKKIENPYISIYDKLVSFDFKNNKYYLKQYKFYIKETDSKIKIYSSYGDYYSNINHILEVESIEEVENKINENFDDIKEQLYIYNYVFQKKDGDIILEKFYKD